MRVVLTFSAMAALVMLPSPARACPFSEAMTPFLFDALPAVPPGAFAARVQIIARDTHGPEIRARIVAMIVGDYAGSILGLQPSHYTSCDRFPMPGETGIVVGRVISSSPEALVIDPVRAPSAVQRGEVRLEVVPAPQ